MDIDDPASSYLPDLAGNDLVLSEAAARSLVELGEEAVPALRQALGADDANLRARAALVLERLGPEAAPAVPELIERLGEFLNPERNLLDPERVGEAAAEALRAVGAAGLPARIEALSDADGQRRAGAAWSFRKQALPPHAQPALLALLDDPTPDAAAMALLAIPAQDDSIAERLAELLDAGSSELRERVLEALNGLGRRAAPAQASLLACLDAESARQRARSALVLGRIGKRAESAWPQLCQTARDHDPEVRAAAWRALARVRPGVPPEPTLLATGLEDQEPTVRLAALALLARLGRDAEPLAEAVARCCVDANPDVRVEALSALVRLAEPAHHEAPGVFEPFTQLPHQPHPLAVPRLRAALSDGEAEVRGAAATLLGMLPSEQAAAAAPELTSLLSDRDESVRDAAAATLGQLGPQALSPLCQLAAHEAGPEAARLRALGLIGRLRHQAEPARELLERLMADPSPALKQAARQALERLG